ncbi:unnamed protein product [Caretta caretta]
MDHGSRFFYALEKMRGAKKHITCLLAEDGTPLTEPAEMCGRARALYASLFSPHLTDPGACRVLWEELPTVSMSDRDRLELPLTLAEFLEALRRMPTNKSPGMDGLTMEFYCVFWDVLGPDLVTVWAKSLQSGVLPLSCSTDYKIVVKAISVRLGSVLADVIHPDQTYTVPDRRIFDNLFLDFDSVLGIVQSTEPLAVHNNLISQDDNFLSPESNTAPERMWQQQDQTSDMTLVLMPVLEEALLPEQLQDILDP